MSADRPDGGSEFLVELCLERLIDHSAGDGIKVEPPGGDLGRAWGPPFWGDDSTLFLSSNRGKESVVVDLKDADGMAVLRRLATSCDIFVQASRPSAARRLGIDYESVRGWRDDVIHLSVSAYGPDGPMSDQPGYDPLMQAYAGIMSVTGQPGGAPTRVGGSVVDFGTGMWAVIAILAALRTRDATGQGAALDASLMDTSLGWVSYHLMGYMATGVTPGPMGSGLGSIAPYRAFRTADGHVMIAAGNDGIFGRLCTASCRSGPGARSPDGAPVHRTSARAGAGQRDSRIRDSQHRGCGGRRSGRGFPHDPFGHAPRNRRIPGRLASDPDERKSPASRRCATRGGGGHAARACQPRVLREGDRRPAGPGCRR